MAQPRKPPPRDIASSLKKLKITSPKDDSPLDSWEDNASSDTDSPSSPGSGTATPVRQILSSDYPGPPPPTPSSPSFSSSHTSEGLPYQTFPPFGFDGTSTDVTPAKRTGSEDRRPEKTTAVASRLIAAGIGQKAPKRTKEQREYDQAVRLLEKKKRDAVKQEESDEKEASERAKKAIWDD